MSLARVSCEKGASRNDLKALLVSEIHEAICSVVLARKWRNAREQPATRRGPEYELVELVVRYWMVANLRNTCHELCTMVFAAPA